MRPILTLAFQANIGMLIVFWSRCIMLLGAIHLQELLAGEMVTGPILCENKRTKVNSSKCERWLI